MLAITMSLDLITEMCVEVTCVTSRTKYIIAGAQFSNLSSTPWDAAILVV